MAVVGGTFPGVSLSGETLVDAWPGVPLKVRLLCQTVFTEVTAKKDGRVVRINRWVSHANVVYPRAIFGELMVQLAAPGAWVLQLSRLLPQHVLLRTVTKSAPGDLNALAAIAVAKVVLDQRREGIVRGWVALILQAVNDDAVAVGMLSTSCARNSRSRYYCG